MMSPMLFRNHFQLGYAVRDVDEAIKNLGETFGVTKWQVLRLPVDAPGRALAFAYVSGMMIELVDVKPGQLSFYDNWIPDSKSAVKLHHFGYMVDSEEDWRRIEERFKDLGVAMVTDQEMGDILAFRYFDTVAELGHYCEYVFLKPAGKDFWANVPHN